MTLTELFRKQDYQIPIRFSSDDYKTEVSKLLTSYIKDLELCGVSEETIRCVKQFRYSCSFTLSNYLKGIHSNAFYNFGKAIDALQVIDSKRLSARLDDTILYRARENKDIEDFSDDQMYHIPLSNRGIIATQRYSFPGLPCLYLCASAYTCWVEMNRPSFERFQVAAIRPEDAAKKMKVLDLSRIPQGEILDEEYVRYWPLLALCSVKVRNEKDAFKPEYIFPQFLLEYVQKANEEYIGIKYVSIKAATISEKQFTDDWHTYVNYVFPSRSDCMDKIKCSYLDERFKIIKTRSGKELQILARMLEVDHVRTRFGVEEEMVSVVFAEPVTTWKIYTRDGKAYPYSASVFGMIEEALNRDDFEIDVGDTLISIVNEKDIDEL